MREPLKNRLDDLFFLCSDCHALHFLGSSLGNEENRLEAISASDAKKDSFLAALEGLIASGELSQKNSEKAKAFRIECQRFCDKKEAIYCARMVLE
ncbi:MAG: hypothetical protein V1494_03160 [Candidatus Diapherotrites archaeon]